MAPASVAVGGKSGQAKLDEVTSLLRTLKLDLTDKKLKEHQRETKLEQLKVFGRDATNADPIFTQNGIETLALYAFESTSISTSREALRCLANALLLKEETRQILVDCGAATKAAEKLKSDSCDDEFLLSRILFLMTYGSDANFEQLINDNGLGESINECLSRHAKRYSKSGRRLSLHPSLMDDMALTETAKLLFNINHFYPDLAPTFSKSIPYLLTILSKSKISSPPLSQPLSAVINALINLDLAETTGHHFSRSALFPKFDPKGLPEHIVNILDAAISSYRKEELDQVAAPVLSLIRKIYEIAPDNVKRYMEFLLLPTDAERSKPLGKSDTLSSRLLQLSTSALTPTLRTSISAMMFELSGQDSNKFVHNVGYGFAAGFLMSQNMPIPENASEAYAAGNADGEGASVNPVTGQKLSEEVDVDDGLPPMTDEEKEREAERLFVLFERLKKTGVVDVVNPFEKMRDEGRFEELPD